MYFSGFWRQHQKDIFKRHWGAELPRCTNRYSGKQQVNFPQVHLPILLHSLNLPVLVIGTPFAALVVTKHNTVPAIYVYLLFLRSCNAFVHWGPRKNGIFLILPRMNVVCINMAFIPQATVLFFFGMYM